MPSALRKPMAVVFWLHVTAGTAGVLAEPLALGQNHGLTSAAAEARARNPTSFPSSGPGPMRGEHVPATAPSFGASGLELSTGSGGAGSAAESEANAGASSASHGGGSSSPSD